MSDELKSSSTSFESGWASRVRTHQKVSFGKLYQSAQEACACTWAALCKM